MKDKFYQFQYYKLLINLALTPEYGGKEQNTLTLYIQFNTFLLTSLL